MTKYFAFVDENKEGTYRLGLVAIPDHSISNVRTSMKSLRLRGQRRVHMAKESASRRKIIIDTILRLESWTCLIVESKTRDADDALIRQRLFLIAAQHPLWKQIDKLVVEDSTDSSRDRKTLAWLQKHSTHWFTYSFEKPYADSALWLADAVLWAYAKGSNYRRMVAHRLDVLKGP
jgi:hypothetical protein